MHVERICRLNDQLTEHVIGAAIEVHRLLESIYEEALCVELQLRGIAFERQVSIDVLYKGHIIKGQRLDLLVEGQVVVELKSQAKSPETAIAQVLSYLKATGMRRGLLINFGLPRLRDGLKRISL
ncbi:hypothetical protein SE17_13830 [Kouleothrix aurantiaca]|uniref:GxxExxY protein n=1 Tax=Kouleothrix aurantiaca TaxID=186479 RepID=A0A0N8PSH2_9CHLR|nr:hypothetical protein SE17_13830 [Kouleothrix aurantiaca]